MAVDRRRDGQPKWTEGDGDDGDCPLTYIAPKEIQAQHAHGADKGRNWIQSPLLRCGVLRSFCVQKRCGQVHYIIKNRLKHYPPFVSAAIIVDKSDA